MQAAKNLVQPFESYLNSIYIQSNSSNTLVSYKSGLKNFTSFVETQYHTTVEDIVASLKAGKEDPYKLLNGFVLYLVNRKLKPKSVKLFVGVTKGFLRHSGTRSMMKTSDRYLGWKQGETNQSILNKISVKK